MDNADRPIIFKKVVKGSHPHHGGAWKVAYADFVTAMMAFFLLLWLLNVTTSEQKSGIADYFSPASISRTTSGSGGVLGGKTMVTDGAKISDSGAPSVIMTLTASPRPIDELDESEDEPEDGPIDEREGEAETEREVDPAEAAAAERARAAAEREEANFEEAKEALQQAIQEIPEFAELAKHILIDTTPEGLRIQLVDQDRKSMFPRGGAELLANAETLMLMITRVVERLPNKIKITGHTDASPYRSDNGYGNWELSADRANASRRALLQAGLAPSRITQVSGKADTDPLNPEDPLAATNRRISIVLLRETKAQGSPTAPAASPAAPAATEKSSSDQPTPGIRAGHPIADRLHQ